MASCAKDWIDILSALLTPTVAILGSYIALRQWRTAELKRKQNLFDKIYDIYAQTQIFLSEICITANQPSTASEKLFVRQFGASYFLCDTEVKEYLKHLHHQGCKLGSCNYILSNPANPGFAKAAQEKADLLDYFNDQISSGTERTFQKYLKIKWL
jgi:FMN phosphatase YigB (HAD superfamily)